MEAAATKWNFLPFKPGLVGGHCIGVDPYYLAQKAQEVGYHPEIILAGRRLNDGMGAYIAHEVVRLMIRKDLTVKGAEILVLGITFKENCPDVRNTRVVDIIAELQTYDTNVTVYDYWANPEDVQHEYGITTIQKLEEGKLFDTIILAVAHSEFGQENWKTKIKPGGIIYDVKGFLPKSESDARL